MQTHVRKCLDSDVGRPLQSIYKHTFEEVITAVYRSTSRPAASLLPLIQALSLALLFALPTVWSAKVFTASPARYDHVVVHRGDSLWSLVSKHAARTDDVAEAVYQAAAINHMHASDRLQPGAVVLLPHP